MRRIVILCLVLAGCHGRPAPTPAPTPQPDVAITPQNIVDGHNKQRAYHKMSKLTLNPQLQAAAEAHAKYMATKGRMAHFGIGDGDPWSRISDAGYKYQGAGENVAWNQSSVAMVMEDWMNSPGHRANILGDYTEMGAAMAKGSKGDPYWCATFGKPGAALRAFPPVAGEPPEPVKSKHGYLTTPFRMD